MSTNLSIISVTVDSRHLDSHERRYSSASSNADDNDMDYNQNIGGATDVEDFDSYADIEKSCCMQSPKDSLVKPKCSQNDLTDIEDYNDSEPDGADDDKSNVYPELKQSLQEFLQHDFQVYLSSSNGMKESVEHKTGNFLQAQNLNALNDYLTDCEDFNTDSDAENNYEKSVCIDLQEAHVERSSVNIADTKLKIDECVDSDCENNDISVVSDISGMASALSDITGNDLKGISEDEIFQLSSNPEVCPIHCSDSDSISSAGSISEENLLSSASLPPIDVTFFHDTIRLALHQNSTEQALSAKGGPCQSIYLEVARTNKEEVLTDIERFDDSVAEGDNEDSLNENEQIPIPQAVTTASGDDGGCTTDCEDLLCDDLSETAVLVHESRFSVDLKAIPPPQREIVMLHEDKFGDTIASVMPMEKEYQFGIYANTADECLTNTEEYSCSDDLDVRPSLADSLSRSPSPSPQNMLVESGITVANELLKPQQSKRLEIISNMESITDVEEIYMAGTSSRKKKLKSRPATRNKSKFLETPTLYHREDGCGTDIEDMELSESGVLPGIKCVKKVESSRQTNQSHSEKVTDTEDFTADDVSSVSESELPIIQSHISNLKDYESSSKNIVVTLETCGTRTCTQSHNYRKTINSVFPGESDLSTFHNLQQQQTDVEDVQLLSDTEDNMNMNEPIIDYVGHELSEMLNESCTTVHERCGNSFNIDAEKLHIKGMLRESHTDIEYVESDESAARSTK